MKYNPDPEKLRRVCDFVLGAKQYKPKEGNTYCNLAVSKIMDGVCGETPFYDEKKKRVMLANEMIVSMEGRPSMFVLLKDGMDAFDNAKEGYVVIACKTGEEHGHIVVLYPSEEPEFSASWDKAVPMLANVGKVNAIMRASKCFKEEPKYYCVLPF